MPPSVPRPKPTERWTRGVLVAGYAGIVAFGLVSELQPRVFWTMLLPLLPAGIVLMGFHAWRRVCPLAVFGELGRSLHRGPQRRVPDWLERWFFPFTFALLLLSLVLRLVATNGDRLWLSGLLVGLALAAALTNAAFTGKTWCNFVCPVGFVERVYTEPRSLRATASSQCATCTACKRHCPDIDQENAYWKDVTSAARQLAVYAFPGLVLSFYVYYWLRHGDWEAYFDGRWTAHPVDAALVLGSGFYFAPAVPALAAATLTLVSFSLASYLLFRLLERGLVAVSGNPERGRHLGLALAAFAAFNLFYLFAGAPSLRRLPGGARVVAFAAPLLGAIFLVRRWQRTPEQFIAERGAARLVRYWPFDEPPPRQANEVYGWIQASRHAREKSVAGYAATVRNMVADGLVGAGELRLLDVVRRQLGISEREHEQVLAGMSEDERLRLLGGEGIETLAQLEGYQVALAEALQRTAPEEELAELRHSFGVDAAGHDAVLARIRGESGELVARARRRLERARELDDALATCGRSQPTPAGVFLCYLLSRARDAAVSRLLDLLETVGDGPVIRSLRGKLVDRDPDERGPALRVLALACPAAAELLPGLERLLAGIRSGSGEPADDAETRTLLGLLAEPDPYLRAGAVWAAAGRADGALASRLAGAREDEHPLVRDTAALVASPAAEAAGGLASIEVMYFLHVAPFFGQLDPGDLYELAQFAIEETVHPPATICEAGEAGSDALFVLVSGRAVVVRPGADGSAEVDRPLATLGRGDLIGELAVLDGSPRSATVRPEGGPARVLRIPGPSLRGLLLAQPRVAQSLLELLAGRIRRMMRPDAPAR